MTVIRLHPCGSTIICGPCLPCPEYHDLPRTGPDARVVYVQGESGWTFTGGSVTYNTGGSPTTVGMSIVGSTQKLCLGRNQSVNGPLVYTAAVPAGATITEVSYDYGDGIDTFSVTGESSDTCTNYLTQILRILGSLDCDAAPSVVLLAASCVPCTENTGTTGAGISSNLEQWTIPFKACAAAGCTVTFTTGYTTAIGNSSVTPASTARPCNWTDLAFTTTLQCSRTYSAQGSCSGTVVHTWTVTVTKTAGSGVLSFSAMTRQRTASMTFDGVIRATPYPYTDQSGVYDVPCSGYRLRLSPTSGSILDACAGGGKTAQGTVAATIYLEPR